VNEMIKHRFVPDIEHSVRFQYLLQAMRPERAECDGKKTKRSCNPESLSFGSPSHTFVLRLWVLDIISL